LLRVFPFISIIPSSCTHCFVSTVLAAAARRITSSRAAKAEDVAAASIPIPDATGVVENHTEQYPPDVWTDPITYIKSSDTVEENVEGVLLGGFMYDMDERDVEWLEKNNSIARGEGSSTSPVSGRSHVSSRNAKTRGKEGKEVTDRPSFVITETELELVMVLFEMFTDERYPYLHLVCHRLFIVHVASTNSLSGCH
jgi:enhancer of polycomb-like protein